MIDWNSEPRENPKSNKQKLLFMSDNRFLAKKIMAGLVKLKTWLIFAFCGFRAIKSNFETLVSTHIKAQYRIIVLVSAKSCGYFDPCVNNTSAAIVMAAYESACMCTRICMATCNYSVDKNPSWSQFVLSRRENKTNSLTPMVKINCTTHSKSTYFSR